MLATLPVNVDPITAQWTEADAQVAAARGWAIVGLNTVRHARIVAAAGSGFTGDSQAWLVVVKEADGCAVSAKALALIGQLNPDERSLIGTWAAINAGRRS